MTFTQQNSIVHSTVLDNGLTLLSTENTAADIIACRIFIRAGSLWETPEKAGLANLLSAVITKGTTELSSAEIAEKIESVGAGVSANAASDYFILGLKTISSDFGEILALVGEMMRSPSFPEAEVELERTLTLQDIRSQQEQPFNVAFNQLREIMYGDHPYRLSTLGTLETVMALSREDLQQFHSTYFRPDNIVISLSGRISPDSAAIAVNQVFGDWKAPSTSLPSLKFPSL
ncbi:MAG: M16 family metallopeptidase, partial [Chroococcales cyanobacterium]